MITFLSGGTGTPKLIQGFREILNDEDLVIITNTGDNIWLYGLYISPDIDTILYLFSGLLDEKKFWGIKEDTFNTCSFLKRLGFSTWFNIGDKDFGTHLFRTKKIHEGFKLSEVTKDLAERLNIKARILSSTDNHMETRIVTKNGDDIHFQEFWVKHEGMIEIEDVYFKDIEHAIVPSAVLEAIENSELIIIGPSNPITSISPIVNIETIRKCLIKNKSKCIAISPIIGDKPISGPTGKLMASVGKKVTALEVANIYRDFCSLFIIDESEGDKDQIISKELGIKVIKSNILFKNREDAKNLAKFILTGEIFNEK